MPQSSSSNDIIRHLNAQAVRQLLAVHQKMQDEPLVLAVRYHLDDPEGHIYLLEVLDRFPGADDDDLLVTEFAPSANLRIVGNLHLVLGSPAQLRSAAGRGDPIAMAAKSGEVVFDDGSAQAKDLKRDLGFPGPSQEIAL